MRRPPTQLASLVGCSTVGTVSTPGRARVVDFILFFFFKSGTHTPTKDAHSAFWGAGLVGGGGGGRQLQPCRRFGRPAHRPDPTVGAAVGHGYVNHLHGEIENNRALFRRTAFKRLRHNASLRPSRPAFAKPPDPTSTLSRVAPLWTWECGRVANSPPFTFQWGVRIPMLFTRLSCWGGGGSFGGSPVTTRGSTTWARRWSTASYRTTGLTPSSSGQTTSPTR